MADDYYLIAGCWALLSLFASSTFLLVQCCKKKKKKLNAKKKRALAAKKQQTPKNGLVKPQLQPSTPLQQQPFLPPLTPTVPAQTMTANAPPPAGGTATAALKQPTQQQVPPRLCKGEIPSPPSTKSSDGAKQTNEQFEDILNSQLAGTFNKYEPLTGEKQIAPLPKFINHSIATDYKMPGKDAVAELRERKHRILKQYRQRAKSAKGKGKKPQYGTPSKSSRVSTERELSLEITPTTP